MGCSRIVVWCRRHQVRDGGVVEPIGDAKVITAYQARFKVTVTSNSNCITIVTTPEYICNLSFLQVLDGDFSRKCAQSARIRRSRQMGIQYPRRHESLMEWVAEYFF